MNVIQLESLPPVSQLDRFPVDATEKDANFLSFRQLNKRARVRLSPIPFAQETLPVKSNLFSAAHLKGWFVAAIQDSSGFSLIFATLAALRATFSSSSLNDEIPFTPQRTLALAPATPTIVAFASHDSRMLVSLTSGQILVYDTSMLFTSGSDNVLPLHSFPSVSSAAPRQILPNPGDMPDLVAILLEPGTSQSVQILDVQKMEPVGGWLGGNSPDSTPASLSWSPKGKQLAVGLLSGDILTFSPSATASPKLRLPPLLSPTNEPQSLVSTIWLSSPTFYVIYAPPSPPDAEQTHLIATQDAKSSTLSSSKFTLPIYSLPGVTPGPFSLLLRNWDPVKMILLIGDRSSSDIGVIGAIGDNWHTFNLDETATPSLPLDKDGNETLLLALEVDLSSSQTLQTSIAGEDVELPPPPVMYAYAGDGTLQGWYIVNAQGTAYPGMITPSTGSPQPAMGTSMSGQTPSPLAHPPNKPAFSFDSTGFGAIKPATGFGSFGNLVQHQSPSQGSSQASEQVKPVPVPAFGMTGFETKSSTTFGQPSFPTVPAVVAPSSGGFGAFASGGLAAFGTPSQSGANQQPAWSTNSGGAGNGGPNKHAFISASGFGGGSVFGNKEPGQDMAVKPSVTSKSPSSSPEPRRSLSPFGINDSPPVSPSPLGTGSAAFITGTFGQLTTSSTGFRPASGFGAFGSDAQPSTSPFFSSSSEVKPVSVFASTPSSSPVMNTGPTTTPTFGTSSVLGGGKPSFGTSPTTTPAKAPAPTTGGFSAFSGSSVGFGAFAGTSKPFAAGGGANSFGGGSVFGNREPSQDTPVKLGVLASDVPSPLSLPEPHRSPSPYGVNDSHTVSPSPFGTSAPAVTTGAFGQLRTSSSGFIRPASGFGAFGSDAKPSASPFFNPVSEVKPVSVFASTPSSSPVTNTGATTTPTFGTSSVLGSGKSAFGGSSTTSTPVKALAPTTGGFSAFSGSPVGLGFGAFAGSSKPFVEFLKDGNVAKDPEKPTSPSFGSPAPKLSGDTKTTSTELAQAGTQPEDDTQSHISGFSEDSQLPNDNGDVKCTEMPSSSESTHSLPKLHGNERRTSTVGFGAFVVSSKPFSEFLKGGDDAKDPEKLISPGFGSPVPKASRDTKATYTEPAQAGTQPEDDDTQSHISGFSDDSQTPNDNGDVKGTEKLSASESAPSSPKLRGDERRTSMELEEQLEDDVQSFVSESFSEEPEGAPDDEHCNEEAGSLSSSLSSTSPVEPAKIPLPTTPQSMSRSPSTTPKPEVLDTGARLSTSSASESATLLQRSPSSNIREASTTPPGSPDKGPSPPLQKSPLPVPARVLPSASVTPFGVGLGRPSTRPTRSSPLANVTLSEGDIEDRKTATSLKPRLTAILKPHPPTQGVAFSGAPAKVAIVTIEPSLEQGMQAECLHLFSSLGRELEDLRKLAQQASQRGTELGKPFGSSRHSGSREHSKWTLGDLGQMVKDLKKDIHVLKMQRDSQLQAIRELESHMLKAGTRKEEIARFNKAKTDVEFAKMLKSRTLGPEHLETQTQLRRDIRTIRDRVQKLEDHLQASKRRLSQMKTGMPGLKAPSLDTIKRTYRNIDIAIEQQAQEVANLVSRMATLNVASALQLPSTRDKRLPDTSTRRPVDITPHVAISTAAALNAERSAQRLKLTLLVIRKEPLLNVTTASAPAPAPAVFDSPQSSTSDHNQLLPWGSPESPTHALPSRRTAVVSKRHFPPITLKRSPSSQPVAPPKFDWGPLPSIPPMKTISPDVRRKDGGSPEPSMPLGGSWVTDDFHKK